MKKSSVFILCSVVLLLILMIVPLVHACGCGMAISDFKVFNALKETQAYLLIYVINDSSYNEMPFFRMVSMDEPYNVTIVFPIDGIPYDVEGKTMSVNNFLYDYKLRDADSYILKQSFSGMSEKVKSDINSSSPFVFSFANGFVGLIVSTAMYRFGSVGSSYLDESPGGMSRTKGLAPIKEFEFDGGSLDIYDVSSMDTLKDFVETVNITLTGKVEELVTKYSDYFVAVLHLNVPSVLDADSRTALLSCPEQTEKVKQAIQEKITFTYSEIENLARGPCSEPLGALIRSTTNSLNYNVNGTLVNMKFRGTNNFFYPTSIVNSYKYPITDQKYFIKTPSSLDVNLDSSVIDKTAIFDSNRWYKVTSTEQDIKGKIVPASLSVKTGDLFRLTNQKLYDNTGWIVLLLYVLIFAMPLTFYFLRVDEKLSGWNIAAIIGVFMIGGLLLSSIVMFFVHKRKVSLTLFSIWLLLLVVLLIF